MHRIFTLLMRGLLSCTIKKTDILPMRRECTFQYNSFSDMCHPISNEYPIFFAIESNFVLNNKGDRTAPYALAEEMHAGIQGLRLLPFKGGHIFFLFGERQQFLDATE